MELGTRHTSSCGLGISSDGDRGSRKGAAGLQGLLLGGPLTGGGGELQPDGRSLRKKGWLSPGSVKGSGEQQLIVQCNAHVSRLVEG